MSKLNVVSLKVGATDSSAASPGGFPRTIDSDLGQTVVVHDVVGGHGQHFVATMQQIMMAAFPEHVYAAEQIAIDAMLPGRRDGIVVHQWFVTVDGVPAGISLEDSNVFRGVAPIHFLTVVPDLRSVTIGGVRLGRWLGEDSVKQLERDGAGLVLGAVGETPDYKQAPFLRAGWRVLPVAYVEPVEGWLWPERGMEFREIPLIWLPPHGADIEALEHQVMEAGAAAFLLDMYGLPADHPQVAPLVGAQAHARAPRF